MNDWSNPPLGDKWHPWNRDRVRLRVPAQSSSARLARNRCSRTVRVTRDAGRAIDVDWRLRAITARATVHVADHNTAIYSDCHIKEIEEISIDWSAAATKQTHPLHRQG